MDVTGKKIVVTGGTTGIGFESAKLFIAHGASVLITGQDGARLASALTALGPNATGVLADVRSTRQLADVRKAAEDRFQKVDVVFANAGVAFATPILGTDEALFDTIMDVNVKGVFLTVQALLPLMGPGGSIILNTSWLAEVGTAGLSVLSASKAAVRSFARSLAAELVPQGIRVNAVSPGATATPVYSKFGMDAKSLAEFQAAVMAKIPMGRFGQPQEVAEAALFLASDRSAYMLGAEIAVDGGFGQL